MGFSAVAGWIHARMAGGGWGDTLLGGAIAGGVCGAAGIAVSATLGDGRWSLLALGTAAWCVTGMIGAAAARMLRSNT